MGYSIKTYNQIAERGLARLAQQNIYCVDSLERADAILLRSEMLHGFDFPPSVRAIARAGAGVNNIPVEECSARGIAVFNTPGANANAVKELVICSLLLSSRGIIPGIEFARNQSIDDRDALHALMERQKKHFSGNELYGKTLGIVGLGAIGSMVAEIALSLGMKVVGYDPALSVEAAWRLPNQVERMEGLNNLLSVSDYVTLHVPAIEATINLINADNLSAFKPGSVLVNFAREAIVDYRAVLNALDSGLIRHYICDFPEPAFRNRTDVTAMPHIGASTQEAEENCAVMAAEQLADYLLNGNIKNAINLPEVSMPRVPNTRRLTFINDNVAGVLGQVLSVLAEQSFNVVDMMNKSHGDVAYNIIDMEGEVPETIEFLIGQIEHVTSVRLI